jgi:hypothetical protein
VLCVLKSWTSVEVQRTSRKNVLPRSSASKVKARKKPAKRRRQASFSYNQPGLLFDPEDESDTFVLYVAKTSTPYDCYPLVWGLDFVANSNSKCEKARLKVLIGQVYAAMEIMYD